MSLADQVLRSSAEAHLGTTLSAFGTARLLTTFSVCAVAAGACADAQPSAAASATDIEHQSLSPCDPLAAHESPTQLGTVVAAGQDTDGTLYVADRAPSDPSTDRIFVSKGDTLFRKRISGSGSRAADYTWTFEDNSASKRLVAHKDGDRVTGIALASPDERTFYAELDASAHQLTPVDADVVSGYKVRNLSGEVTVEFVADVEDGSRIVVLRPRDDWSYEDFRLFEGTHGQLFERMSSFDGALSYRAFDFLVGDEHWHITFPSSLSPLAAELRRESDQKTLGFTLVDPPTVPSDVSFECFDTAKP